MCTTNASGTTNLPFCYEVVLEKPIDRVTQAVEFLVSSDRDEAGIIIIRNREKRTSRETSSFSTCLPANIVHFRLLSSYILVY